MPRSPLALDRPCEYRPPGPGLQRWRPALVVSFEVDDLVQVAPQQGNRSPLLIPRAHVRGVTPTQAAAFCWGVCRILGSTQKRPAPEKTSPASGADAEPRVIVARLYGPGKPQPKPRRRIKDPRYLGWLRDQRCICSLTCRRRAQAHHEGPRGVALITDDWRTVPLCARSHLVLLHDQGHLGYLSPEETRQLVLAQQVQHLLQYFATSLRPSAGHWYQRGALVDKLPAEERTPFLRLVVDQLVEHLLQLRWEGGLRHG